MDRDESRRLNRRWNCRVTAVGRRTGKPRSVTIWFVLDDATLYLTGGAENPNWCRNLKANPDAEIEIGRQMLRGRARIVEDESEASEVRQRFVEKYWLARLSRLFGGYTRSRAVVVAPLDVAD